MLTDLQEEELKELEDLLYSQFYHTNVVETENLEKPDLKEESNLNIQSRRYFFQNCYNKNLPFEPGLLEKENNLDMNYQRNDPQNLLQNVDVLRQMTPHCMLNPVNNIVVIPPNTTQIFNSSYDKKTIKKFLNILERKKRKQEKYREKRKMKGKLKKQGTYDKTNHEKSNEKISTLSNKKECTIGPFFKNKGKSYNVLMPQNTEIICLSDDEDNVEPVTITKKNINSINECKISFTNTSTLTSNKSTVENNDASKTIILQENKNMLELEESCDDVIFIEPKEIEVINIDDEGNENQAVINISDKNDCSGSVVQSLDVLEESNTANSLPVEKLLTEDELPSLEVNNCESNLTDKEFRDRLHTPDSLVSNDFLDNNIDIKKNDKFNFGLHGSDFGVFLKPKQNNEIYETESSCSTSDLGTPLKTSVFNEVEFESPTKDLFAGTNLENFGNYITPNRNKSLIEETNLSEKESVKEISTSKAVLSIHNSSESSSSESDYESSKVLKVTEKFQKTSQNLPTLSPLQSDDDKYLNYKKNKYRKSDKLNKTNISSKNKSTEKSKRKFVIDCEDVVIITRALKKKRKELIYSSDDSCNSEISDIESNLNTNNENNTNVNNCDSVEKEKLETEENIQTLRNIESEVDNTKQNENNDNQIKEIVFTEDIVTLSDDENASLSPNDVELVNITSTSELHHEKQVKGSKRKKTFTDYWKNDLEEFYQQNWDQENYSVAEEQKTMSDDPSLWKIIDEDRVQKRSPAAKGPRCFRCRNPGHLANYCPNKSGPPVCSLCAKKGHIENKCRNRICFNCGKYNIYNSIYCNSCSFERNMKCDSCRVKGHVAERCSNLWRRYHLTIEDGPLVHSKGPVLKPPEKRWCCSCASNGHFEFDCRYGSYPRLNPRICNYEDIYENNRNENKYIRSNKIIQSEIKTIEDNSMLNKVENSGCSSIFESNDIQMPPNIYNNYQRNIHFQSTFPFMDQNIQNQLCSPFNAPMINPLLLNNIPNLITPTLHNPINLNQNVPGNSFSPDVFNDYIPLNRDDFRFPLNRNCFENLKFSRIQRTIQNEYAFEKHDTELSTNASMDKFIYYIDSDLAKFFVEDLPGSEYLQILANDLNIDLKVIFEREKIPQITYILITGSIEKINYAKEQLNEFVQKEVVNLRIPHKVKDVKTFIFNYLDRCEKLTCKPQHLINEIEKLNYKIENAQSYENIVMLRSACRKLYIKLNSIIFGRYCLNKEANDHYKTLTHWKNPSKKLFNEILPESTRKSIQNSLNYLFFIKRSIEEYKNYLFFIIKKEVSAYNNQDITQKLVLEVKNQMKFYKNISRKISFPRKFNDLHFLCKQIVNGNEDCYKQFHELYEEFKVLLKQNKKKKCAKGVETLL